MEKGQAHSRLRGRRKATQGGRGTRIRAQRIPWRNGERSPRYLRGSGAPPFLSFSLSWQFSRLWCFPPSSPTLSQFSRLSIWSIYPRRTHAQGFAFAEVWTRPKFEVPAPDGQGVQVQWDHLLKYGDVTYINYSAFPEARNLAGKLDDFKSSGRDVSYARNNSIPGLAWNRHDVDWQVLFFCSCCCCDCCCLRQ